MASHHVDELLQRLEAAQHRAATPVVEELLGPSNALILPEVIEKVFELAGPKDSPLVPFKCSEQLLLLPGSVARVFQKRPTQAFELFTGGGIGVAPLLFAHFINGFVEGFGNVETIKHEQGFG